jgi:hypothetical protein
VLGLEGSRAVFARYKAIRATEREYLPISTDGLQPGARLDRSVA